MTESLKDALLKAYMYSGWFIWQTLDFCADMKRPKKKRSTSQLVISADETLSCSAMELARRIREGETTAQETMDVCIERICQVNEHINAVVAMRILEARHEAQLIDQMLSRSTERDNIASLLPLLGVPFVVKENIAVAGMPNTSGLVRRQRCGKVAQYNALVVSQLIRAGGIVVGVSNLPELALWNECYNKVYGRTINPYNPYRIAGGSSGGSAAIVTTCGVPFSIGTDLAGSVRFPSFCNGVFGHKPSALLVSSDRQYPQFQSLRRRWLNCTGPISRHAEDLWPLLQVMAKDSLSLSRVHPKDVSLDQYGMLCFHNTGLPTPHGTSELSQRQKKVADFLSEECGVKYVLDHDKVVAHIRKRFLMKVQDMFLSYLFHKSNKDTTMKDMLNGEETNSRTVSTKKDNGKKFRRLRECIKYIFHRSDYTFISILSSFEDLVTPNGSREMELAEAFRNVLHSVFAPFGGRAIILYPSFITTAPRRKRTATILNCSQILSVFNVLGFPVTQVPLGLSEEMDPGMPLGLQVASLERCDHVTVRVALELEKKFSGWVPPPRMIEIQSD